METKPIKIEVYIYFYIKFWVTRYSTSAAKNYDLSSVSNRQAFHIANTHTLIALLNNAQIKHEVHGKRAKLFKHTGRSLLNVDSSLVQH